MSKASVIRSLVDGSGLSSQEVGCPILELCGDDRLLIENHRCVIGYNDRKVSVRVEYGVLEIEGRGLVLAGLQKEQLLVRGKIDVVLLLREGCR